MHYIICIIVLTLGQISHLIGQVSPIEQLAKISQASPLTGESYFAEFEYKLFPSAKSNQPLDKAVYLFAKRKNDFDLTIDNINRTIIQGDWVLMINFPTQYIVLQKRIPASNTAFNSVASLTTTISMLDSLMKAGQCKAVSLGDNQSEGRLKITCPHSVYSSMEIFYSVADYQITRMNLQYAQAQPHISKFTNQPPRLEVIMKRQSRTIPLDVRLFNISEFINVNQSNPVLQPTYRHFRFDKQI